MASDENRMDLRDYFSVLRRRRWIVVAATVLATAAALILSLMQTPVYQAQARVLIRPDASLFGNTGPVVNVDYVQTQIQLLRSEPVRQAVEEALGTAPPMAVVPVGTTSVVEVRAESTRPAQAAAVANAYVQAYLDYSRSQTVDALLAAGEEIQRKIDEVQGQVDELTERLNSLPACTGSAPPPECARRQSIQADRDSQLSQLVPLKQRLNQLQVDASFENGGPRLITPATEPTTPIRPTPKRNAALGLGAGLIFGIALAFAFEHLDDSIKSKEDLEKVARDLPVLGLIPLVARWKNRDETYLVAKEEPSSPAAEAYRSLRTSIHFLALDRSPRTIQVTSANASEGKSTCVANLSVVLARAGERVVVVSCDLRRPRLHEFFGLSNAVGFTSVLLGEADLTTALQQVPGEERLWVLASGPLPPNPSELLASDRATEVIQALRRRAEIVLLDSPPVLPVTDAAVLSTRTDSTLIVATAGTTSRRHTARAIEVLRQVGAHLTGSVLNGVPTEGSYGYSYQYYSRQQNGNGRASGKRRRVAARPPSAP